VAISEARYAKMWEALRAIWQSNHDYSLPSLDFSAASPSPTTQIKGNRRKIFDTLAGFQAAYPAY